MSSNPVWGAKFLPLRVHPHFRLTARGHVLAEMAKIGELGSLEEKGGGGKKGGLGSLVSGGGPVSHYSLMWPTLLVNCDGRRAGASGFLYGFFMASLRLLNLVPANLQVPDSSRRMSDLDEPAEGTAQCASLPVSPAKLGDQIRPAILSVLVLTLLTGCAFPLLLAY